MRLWVAQDTTGQWLIRRSDGCLGIGVAGVDGAEIVVIACTGSSDGCLLESVGSSIRIGWDDEAVRVLPLRRRVVGSSFSLEDTCGVSIGISPNCGLMSAPNATAPAAFAFMPIVTMVAGSLFASLSDGSTEAEILRQAIESGDADLIPVAQAVLRLMDAAGARFTWNTATRGGAQDTFHPALRNHAHRTLGKFGSYTADLMADQIERFGWSVGSHTYGIPLVFEPGRGSTLAIGKYCSMANPTVVLANHGARSATSYPFMDMWMEWPGTVAGVTDHVARDVRIGNDVWIGVGAVLLPGTEVGDGAILGAGCVVRGLVPPYAICIGNPGHIARYRFEPDIIARLLRLRWWDWPDGMVDRYIPLLLARDILQFLNAAEAELGS